MNEADGDLERLVELPPEEVAHRGPAAHGLGPAFLPFPPGQIRKRTRLNGLGHGKVPEAWKVGFGDLRRGVPRGSDGPFHVGLARAEVDVTEEDVPDGDRSSVRNGQRVGTAGGERPERHLPGALRVRGRAGLAAGQGDGQGLGRTRRSPDRDCPIALEHHVIAENPRQLRLRADRSQGGKDKKKRQDGSHHRLLQGFASRSLKHRLKARRPCQPETFPSTRRGFPASAGVPGAGSRSPGPEPSLGRGIPAHSLLTLLRAPDI